MLSFFMQISLDEAQKVVNSPVALALILIVGFVVIALLWKNLSDHQKECVEASKQLLATMTAHGTLLEGVGRNITAQWDKINDHTDRIAKVEGRMEK